MFQLMEEQGRSKHLKSGGARSKKGHMTTSINGQNAKRFESIPNQAHTLFGWESKLIILGVFSKMATPIEKISKVEWKNRMPKFASKVKVIILLLWKGNFSIWKGHFCIVCQIVEGAMASLALPVPTSLQRNLGS